MISHRGSLLAIVLVVLVPTSGLTQARLVQGDPAQNRASQQAQTGRPLQPQPANPELTDPEKVTELMALIGELNKWLDSRKDAKNNAAGVLPDAQASLNKLKLRGVRLSGQKRVIDNAAWVASVIHDEYKGLKDAPKDGSSGIRVGMCTGLIGVQVKAAEVEVDGLAEPLTASKASGLFLEPLDA